MIPVQIAKQVNNNSELLMTTGDANSPDALAIAPYAGIKQIPIVFTRRDQVPESVARHIKENHIKKVTIIGGENAVSKSVADQLRNLGVTQIERIAGANRYATSVQIAEKYKSSFASGNVYVASGLSYIDALPASALAAKRQAPIILTAKDRLPSDVNNWFTNHKNSLAVIAVLGGTSVVTNQVRDQLRGTPVSVPTPAPSPVQEEAATVQSYTVRSGDTLSAIANRFSTTVTTIKQLNHLTNDLIHMGQVLKIPGTDGGTADPQPKTVTYTSHTVKSGDNLWNLAIQYGIPMNELLQVNRLNHNSHLTIGQILKVPVHHIPVKLVVSAKHGAPRLVVRGEVCILYWQNGYDYRLSDRETVSSQAYNGGQSC